MRPLPKTTHNVKITGGGTETKKAKQRNVLDKKSYIIWLKINIQLQNEYCDGVTADLIKIIVSKGL